MLSAYGDLILVFQTFRLKSLLEPKLCIAVYETMRQAMMCINTLN